MHGQGTYRWPDGQEYIGEFVEDLMEGNGKCKHKNGTEYVGGFKNCKRYGRGRLRPKNGSEIIGIYNNDCLDGPAIVRYPGGMVEVDYWENGTPVGGGVRWTADRKCAFALNKGKLGKEISVRQGMIITRSVQNALISGHGMI
mmetsp:Transcript_42972/g.64793  ORF Transcript_42972/g.64793 Transcript_42972/m.64793 type:complete len:143 (+) Transcript_42972:357-785(+)